MRARKKLCKRALRVCPNPMAWHQPPNLPSLHDKCPQKTKKAMPSSPMRYRILLCISHSISCLPIVMTSVALVVIDSSRCGVAMLRSCGVPGFAKLSSPEVRFWRQRCRRQQPHKTLVNSGFGASDGAS